MKRSSAAEEAKNKIARERLCVGKKNDVQWNPGGWLSLSRTNSSPNAQRVSIQFHETFKMVHIPNVDGGHMALQGRREGEIHMI